MQQVESILKYPGSKWGIANWIISHMPEHHSYLEPFFGSGAVLFNKDPSNIETVNDMSMDVVNLFRCIRKNPSKLSKLIEATPYSRHEYDSTYHSEASKCRYERARQFLVRCWQGHGYRMNKYKVGWKNDVQGRERAYAMRHWNDLPQRILIVAERLKQVQIECAPAIELIKRFWFSNVLIYCDPPYLFETRRAHVKQQYEHEMSEDDHRELLEVLIQHPGYVVISGYNSSLYCDLLENNGWFKKSIMGSDQSGKRRNELIWMNFCPRGQQRLFEVI